MRKLAALVVVISSFLGASAAFATATIAQEVVNPASLDGTSGTTQTATITASSGSTIHAFTVCVGTTSTATFTDSASGTWNALTTTTPLGGGFMIVANGYRENVGSGSLTVTATYNVSCHHRGVYLIEATGVKTSSSLDGKAGQYQGSVGTGADAISSGNPVSAPTTGAPALVVGCSVNFNNNVSLSAGTGFTGTGSVHWTAQLGGTLCEYKRVSSNGTYPATFTGAATDNWTTHVAIFDEAGGGGGGVRDYQGFFGQPGLAVIGHGPVYQLTGDRLVPVPKALELEGRR